MLRMTMSKLAVVVTLLLAFSCHAIAQPYTFEWLTPAQSDHDTQLNAVDKMEGGAVAIAGFFSNMADFGFKTLSVSQDKAAYVAKLDNEGTFRWAVGATGPQSWASDLATDRSGNIWIAGAFRGSISFGSSGGSLTQSNSNGDGFVAKFDPNSDVVLFLDQLGHSATAIGTDGDDNAYVAVYHGQYYEIIKLAPNGTAPSPPVGPVRIVGASVYDISVQRNGAVAITGKFSNDMTVNGAPLQKVGSGVGIFAAKLRSNGSVAWLVEIGGISNPHSPSIAFGPGGDLYVASAVGTGGGTNAVTTGHGFFVTKLGSNNGTEEWRVTGSATTDHTGIKVLDLAIEGDGDVVQVGSFYGTVRIDGTVPPAGTAGTTAVTLTRTTSATRPASAAYVLRYSGSGVIESHNLIGNQNATFASGVRSLGENKIVLGGGFSGTLVQNGFSISSGNPNSDPWIAVASANPRSPRLTDRCVIEHSGDPETGEVPWELPIYGDLPGCRCFQDAIRWHQQSCGVLHPHFVVTRRLLPLPLRPGMPYEEIWQLTPLGQLDGPVSLTIKNGGLNKPIPIKGLANGKPFSVKGVAPKRPGNIPRMAIFEYDMKGTNDRRFKRFGLDVTLDETLFKK